MLERFTRRAPKNWIKSAAPYAGNNSFTKIIANPRRIAFIKNPHYANYFDNYYSIDENAKRIGNQCCNSSVPVEKININHYYLKSREEYSKKKQPRGYACNNNNPYTENFFKACDRNDEFDDGILKYRDARAKIYQPPKPRSAEDLIKALDRNLSPTLSEDTPQDFYADKMETFLTCRAVAAYLGVKIYEETAVKAIIKVLANSPREADKQMFDAQDELKQREDLIATRNTPPKSEEVKPTLTYQTHVHKKGWGDWKNENQISNDLDQQLQIEAIKINFPDHKVYYSVYYNAEEGWSAEVSNGEQAGTTGKSKPIYGVRIRFDEAGTKKSDILYRVHKFDGNWTDRAKNGEAIYSHGQKFNAIQIKLETKRT